MKLLLADDSVFFRSSVRPALVGWGYEVLEAGNGREALEILQAPDAPDVAILDWVMPEMDGLEVCRRVKAARKADGPYLILLTVRDAKDDVASGLEGGADDY